MAVGVKLFSGFGQRGDFTVRLVLGRGRVGSLPIYGIVAETFPCPVVRLDDSHVSETIPNQSDPVPSKLLKQVRVKSSSCVLRLYSVNI